MPLYRAVKQALSRASMGEAVLLHSCVIPALWRMQHLQVTVGKRTEPQWGCPQSCMALGVKASPYCPANLLPGELQGRDCSSANSPFQLAGVLRYQGNLWRKTESPLQPSVSPAGNSYPSLLI